MAKAFSPARWRLFSIFLVMGGLLPPGVVACSGQSASLDDDGASGVPSAASGGATGDGGVPASGRGGTPSAAGGRGEPSVGGIGGASPSSGGATSGGGAAVGDGGFALTVSVDGFGDGFRDALATAQARWEQVIVGDLPDVTVERSLLESACGVTTEEATLEVDDLAVLAIARDLDGPGGTLGAAGPCLIRGDGSPIVGIMMFDVADVQQLGAAGLLSEVVLHELGHVLGIGTLWPEAGLLSDPSLPANPSANPQFTGADAVAVYRTEPYSGSAQAASVPVEDGADPGSSDGHWRESVFGGELMTPFVGPGPGPAPLSALTIASLADLGYYAVDVTAADPYTQPAGPITTRGTPMNCRLIRPGDVPMD